MVIIHVSLCYRFQTHWEGGFTEREFNERAKPLLDAVNAVTTKDRIQFIGAAARNYEILFPGVSEAVAWRTLFTETYRLLHKKAPLGIWRSIGDIR